MADQMTAKVINAGGGSTRERVLPEEIFGGEINVPLMHQVVTAQLAAARSGTASTKTRAQVRGGGKKPWRQKGTGRARHGSSRSPIWVGGGTVFGPKPREHAVKVPKKMRKAALRGALATKAKDGCIWVLYDWTETRTKVAASLLQQEGLEGRTLLVLDPDDDSSPAVDQAFRNLRDAAFTLVGALSAYDVLVADAIVFTKGAFETFIASKKAAG
ncbi:MAG: 50S ribosomal protein L4 [Actinomycetota bacterium]|nr:50S ribosomal protein L4 [Actinomycetota bacterium]